MKLYTLQSFLTIIIILFASTIFAQQGEYMGNEKDITSSELVIKANETNFNGGFAAMIFEDEKNTYYALKNSGIESKYIKIRILEQSYSDRELVNIGSSLKQEYLMFLVNNTLNVSEDKIIDLFNDYYSIALKEETSMNEEAMTVWLNKHDKYTKN